jgi:sialate O-acetylesterase
MRRCYDHIQNFLLLIPSLLFLTESLYADIKLPKLLSNNLIIQREQEFKIWGWADASEQVEVSVLNCHKKTKADLNGNWTVSFNKINYSKPFSIFIKGKNQLEIKNVVFGDVFLCSGQSNMELSFNRIKYKYPDEVADAYNPFIRQFQVPDGYVFNEKKTDYSSGNWKEVNREHIYAFSGVAYFFAKKIYEKTKVPIGLINCAYGGTDAVSWIDENTVKKDLRKYYHQAISFKDEARILSISEMDNRIHNEWNRNANDNDEGLKNSWKSKTDFSDWKIVNLPNQFNDFYFDLPKLEDELINDFNGIIYFSKEIYIDEPNRFTDAKLELGRIIDADSTFINGNYVGNITYQYPPRRYILNKNYFKKGKNIITVKVTVYDGKGAFVKDRKYELTTLQDTVKLDGEWKYKIGYISPTPMMQATAFNKFAFGVYNYMIAPLANLKFKAILWYQGETNTEHPNDYKAIMQNLIPSWRQTFSNESLPFFYVQLPLYGNAEEYNDISEWAILRQQQFEMQSIPNTFMITALDLGEYNDLHPENKKDVGERLAYRALNILYHLKEEMPDFPVIKSWKKINNGLQLEFKNLDINCYSQDLLQKQFYLIDGYGNYHSASAYIIGKTLSLTSERFSAMKYLRYAWANNPKYADLKNKYGLPLSPISIDLKKLKK